MLPKIGRGSNPKLFFRKNAKDPMIKINEPSIINLGLLIAELIFALAKRCFKLY